MALIHPADGRSARPEPHETPTKHPMICLAGGFGFIIAAALAVHLLFNAVI